MNLWLNIYAKDVKKLSAFYTALGFTPNAKFKTTEQEASFLFDNHITLMIFKEGFFNQAFPYRISTPTSSATILFSISMPTIEAADMVVKRAVALGGRDLGVITELKKPGFYNTGFIDPEGHPWNVLVT
jgi:predicted lactoylglutathione lyase